MKHVQSVMLLALALATAATITQASGAPKPSKSTDKSQDTQSSKRDRGQRVFAQNCSRCHNAPEGFSSHISGTIAKHMRQRALLSDEDYKALLEFLEAH